MSKATELPPLPRPELYRDERPTSAAAAKAAKRPGAKVKKIGRSAAGKPKGKR